MTWTPEKVKEHARTMREASKEMHEKGDLYLKQAIMLEDIAKDWTAAIGSGTGRAHWIRWGLYLKCSACGHLTEQAADICPECHSQMEEKK